MWAPGMPNIAKVSQKLPQILLTEMFKKRGQVRKLF